MKTALIPGSFDPMTVGHLDIIERTSAVFDRVVVAVMINENKKYCFTMEERKKIAELSVAHLDNVTVVSYSGWLYELFDKISADAIVKGVRNEKDLAYENEMALFNISQNPKAHTLYLPASSELEEVSSTLFRSTEDRSYAVSKYIPDGAKEYVLSILK